VRLHSVVELRKLDLEEELARKSERVVRTLTIPEPLELQPALRRKVSTRRFIGSSRVHPNPICGSSSTVRSGLEGENRTHPAVAAIMLIGNIQGQLRPPSFSAKQVVASVSGSAAPLSPGMLVTIYGRDLGPVQSCEGQADLASRETPDPGAQPR
jgi:hypothetical protein